MRPVTEVLIFAVSQFHTLALAGRDAAVSTLNPHDGLARFGRSVSAEKSTC
jgi:hypothetical protein